MKDIDLLNERIRHIMPMSDAQNSGVVYACITFEDGTRRDITFKQFEECARKGFVSADNLAHFEKAKGLWDGIITTINEGGTFTA
jgi:hypothetical protein